ncbi:MAG: hypothetical protein CMH28_09390 [Micavibrio sp.]|nr:hypothetical protein [Micavibrio sp.]
MSKNTGPNKKNLEQTRKLFLKIAKKEFITYGYADSSTNRIVEASGMARGSLYYHFKDKRHLFFAVYTQMLADMDKRIRKKMEDVEDPWQAIKLGCNLFLKECKNQNTRKLLIEGLTAIPYNERLAIHSKTLLKTFEEYLGPSMKNGQFKGQDPLIVTIMIYGMMSELGRSFELVEKPEQYLKQITDSLNRTLDKIAA